MYQKYITLMKYSVIILFSIWKLRSWFNCRFCIVGKVTFSDCTSETIYTRSKLSIFLQGFGIQIIALGVCIWKHNSSTKGIIFAHFQFTRIYGTLLNFFNLNLIWLQWRRRAVFSGAGWGDILLPSNLFQEKKKKKSQLSTKNAWIHLTHSDIKVNVSYATQTPHCFQ